MTADQCQNFVFARLSDQDRDDSDFTAEARHGVIVVRIVRDRNSFVVQKGPYRTHLPEDILGGVQAIVDEKIQCADPGHQPR